jgi:hypothetical protein
VGAESLDGLQERIVVPDGLADELLPHVLNTWCVRHAAHPAD